MRTSIITAATVAAVLCCTGDIPPAWASKNPLALMHESEKRHRIPDAEKWTVKMVLQKAGGKPRERVYIAIRQQDDQSGDRSRIHFTSPPNLRGTSLLTLEQRKKGKRVADDDQWLYLSAFKRPPRRLGAAELGDRFAASDIFYEDIKRRQVDDYTYKLLREEKFDGHDCYVIESKPGPRR